MGGGGVGGGLGWGWGGVGGGGAVWVWEERTGYVGYVGKEHEKGVYGEMWLSDTPLFSGSGIKMGRNLLGARPRL